MKLKDLFKRKNKAVTKPKKKRAEKIDEGIIKQFEDRDSCF